MASELAAYYMSIVPSARGLQQNLAREFAGAETAASRSGHTIGKNMGGSFASSLKKVAGPALALFGIGAVKDFATNAVGAFSELEDSTAAAGVVFGDNMKSIIDQSSTASKNLGLTQQQVINAANTFGTYGKAAGLSGQELADFATQQTSLAADMASFKGTSPEQAIEAIGAALRGETEPIRAYGVMLDDASLKNQAMAMGLISTTKDALTPQQKTLAAQALILKQTSDAQGDFARTSDSTANVQKTLSATTADVSAKFGSVLAPAFTAARESALGAVGGVGSILDKVLAFQGALSAGAMTPDLVKAIGLDPSQGFGAVIGEGIGSIRAFGNAWKANDGDITSSGLAGFMEQAAFKLRGFLEVGKEAAGVFLAKVGPAFRELGPPLLALLMALSPVQLVFAALIPVLPEITALITSLAVTASDLAVVVASALTSALQVLAPIITGLITGFASFLSGVTDSQGGIDLLMAAVVVVGGAFVAYKVGVIAATIATNAQAFAAKAAAAGQWLMNAAMSANPIGIVVIAIAGLVAGLVYFFTQTEMGRTIIENVWGAIKTYIGGIARWFQTYVLPVIQAVFSKVGTIFSWLYDNIVKPVFDGIKWYIGAWWTVVSGIFQLVVAFFRNVLAPVFTWLWNNVAKPVFDGIGKLIGAFWNLVVKPIFDALIAFMRNILAPAFMWFRDNVIKPVWDFISDKIATVWNDKVKPVFNALKRGVEALPAAFEAAKGGIETAWNAVRDVAKKPVEFVINKVINDGLIGTFNKIPGVKIDRISLPPGFAHGGYTGDGGKFDPAGVVHKGEYVFTKEQTAALGKDHLASMAHAAIRGGAASGLADGSSPLFFGGLQQAFKSAGTAYVRNNGASAWNIPGAANLWSGAAGLKVQAGNGSPGMTATQRPLGSQILGYAYSNGDISLASGWVNSLSAMQRRTTAAHEIGHVLGLPHNTNAASMMHPNLGSQATAPTPADIRNLQSLYPGGSGKAGSGAENPFDGLIDKLMGEFKAAFPGSGMFVDAAGGFAKAGIEQVIRVVSDVKEGLKNLAGNVFGKVRDFFGGGASTAPTLYDNGGILGPGNHLVSNRTRKPEAIFTNEQAKALVSGKNSSEPSVLLQVENMYGDPVHVVGELRTEIRRGVTSHDIRKVARLV